MRIKTLAFIALTGFGLSGCSLLTKSDATEKSVQSDIGLRTAPGQAYQFDGQLYDVEIYDIAEQYAGYDVEIFNPSQFYYYGYNDSALRPLVVANGSDPRDATFIKLNGASQPVDWQNCESRHRGYLFASEYDVRLDPAFEVCMRNKGYVLSTEYGSSSKMGLSAKTAGLRGAYRQDAAVSSTSAFFR